MSTYNMVPFQLIGKIPWDTIVKVMYIWHFLKAAQILLFWKSNASNIFHFLYFPERDIEKQIFDLRKLETKGVL